jgi:hypothetical protein
MQLVAIKPTAVPVVMAKSRCPCWPCPNTRRGHVGGPGHRRSGGQPASSGMTAGTPTLAVQASGSRPVGDRGPLCAAVPCPVEPPAYPGGPRPGRAASKHDWAAAAPGGLMPGGRQPEPVISRGTTIPGAGLLRSGPGQVATERPGSVQCHRTWCRAPSCTAPAASRARSSSCSAVAGLVYGFLMVGSGGRRRRRWVGNGAGAFTVWRWRHRRLDAARARSPAPRGAGRPAVPAPGHCSEIPVHLRGVSAEDIAAIPPGRFGHGRR